MTGLYLAHINRFKQGALCNAGLGLCLSSDFQMGRGREGPAHFLDKFEGILQTDGFVSYVRGVGGPKMVHAACWSHARRGFVDAIKLNKLDAASISIVELMDKLFAIDARARTEKMDHAARHVLRLQEAPPLLDKIHAQILELSTNVLPKSAAGEACAYTVKLWKKLTCFLEYPELELRLSNNLAENSMRGVALSRNYVHSQIMCGHEAKKCVILRIHGPFAQMRTLGRCA